MNRFLSILLIGLFALGCKEQAPQGDESTFNQELADELKQLAEVDQIAAYIPQGAYKQLSEKEWNAFKDSVFTTHQIRMEEIFDEYGFVGFDLAGEEGSQNFWLMVQHSDHKPGFQKEVLEKMKIEVDKNNAKPSNYGLLVDRVRLNTGEKQVYGTQVTYNLETGQAVPKNLEERLNVNDRRKSIGLEPLEVYLNRMTEMHFKMNKENYLKKGITEPNLYEVK